MRLSHPVSAAISWRARIITGVASLALLALVAAAPALAQTWNEVGDAGDLPGTAQTTTGSGPLSTIHGTLSGPTDVDMYCIHVTDPISFLAGLLCTMNTEPGIYLFDATGKGVAGGQICQAGYMGGGINGAFVSGAGTYYLAVAPYGLWPYAGANPIWLPATTLTRAPDGPGAPNPITSWNGAGVLPGPYPYTINLFGVGYCDASTPAHQPSWGATKLMYR